MLALQGMMSPRQVAMNRGKKVSDIVGRREGDMKGVEHV